MVLGIFHLLSGFGLADEETKRPTRLILRRSSAYEFRGLVLSKLTEKPPNGLANWDGPTLAVALNVSDDAVW